ncbi:MAG: MltA domain-containing protein [Pseudomonadota bacterium]
MNFLLRKNLYLGLGLLLMASGCADIKQDHFEARQVGFAELTGWEYDNHLAALETFRNSCGILAVKSRPVTSESGIDISSLLWGSLCNEAGQVMNNMQAREFFERRFVPYRIANNGKEQGLFTGYYEPVLHGSLRKSGDYKYPLYAAPPELKNQKPYYSRAEIDQGALAKRGLEIVWVDDPVMLFFMQIQGSGRVRLKDGRELRIGYGDQNGHPYVSLGKIMGDEGYLPKDGINFFTIRQWLYENPNKAISLMQRNPSYVFFKIIDKPIVVGSIGAPLTPKRSIAIDSKYIPYGLPLYMETELPGNYGATTFRRLMVAQDTGGAIRSPVRADIFFGAGDEAEYLAGYMKNQGIYSLLVPKEITSQMQ